MRRNSIFVAVALLVAATLLQHPAFAVPVSPGAADVAVGPFVEPGGFTVVAEDTSAVPFTYTAPADLTFDAAGTQTTRTENASFTQRVLRDTATNRLSFSYHFDLTVPGGGPFGTEAQRLSVANFSGTSADVLASILAAGDAT